MRINRPLWFGISLILLVWLPWHPVASNNAPRAVVERLHDALVQAMRAGQSAGYDGRARRLRPVLRATFDFDFISRLVVGKHAGSLGAESIEQLAGKLATLSEVRYADNFRDYQGEQFITREEKEAKRGRRLVRTVLRVDGRDKVNFDYLLHRVSGHWRIISVIAQGVSDLALKRSQYPAVIEKEGFAALLKRIDKQVEHIRTEARNR